MLISLEAAFSPAFSIETRAGGGYSYMYINHYPYHWFHVCASLSPVFHVPLGRKEPGRHVLLLSPVELYAAWAPKMYLMGGIGLGLGYRLALPWGSVDVLRLRIRALLRDTVFDSKWHFQATAGVGLAFGGGY